MWESGRVPREVLHCVPASSDSLLRNVRLLGHRGFGCCCTSCFLNAWTPLQLHIDHLARIVRCRALSGCCVATSLVACPGLSNAWELIPWGGGWGRHCSSPAWSETWQPFHPSIWKSSVDSAHVWEPSSNLWQSDLVGVAHFVLDCFVKWRSLHSGIDR